MVKAPSLSAHSTNFYAAKYKPWRRGKAAKAKAAKAAAGADGVVKISSSSLTSSAASASSSLKHQLRGLERLLARTIVEAAKKEDENEEEEGESKADMNSKKTEKMEKKQEENGKKTNKDKNNNKHDAPTSERIRILQESIAELQDKMQQRQMTERERSNARKSHKNRFLDRQRLMRLWQHTWKQRQRPETRTNDDDDDKNNSSNNDGEDDKNNNSNYTTTRQALYQLGLDMLYVAHFPHAVMSYQPLFASNKKRNAFPRGRALAKVVSARQKILPVLLAASLEPRDDAQQPLQQSLEPPQDDDDNDNDNNNPQKHTSTENKKRASWIPAMVYEELLPLYPSDWSVALERETFQNYPTTTTSSKDPRHDGVDEGDKKGKTPKQESRQQYDQGDDMKEDTKSSRAQEEDPRFSTEHTKSALENVLREADRIDAELDRQDEEEEEEDVDSRNSSDDDKNNIEAVDEDEDWADPLIRQPAGRVKQEQGRQRPANKGNNAVMDNRDDDDDSTSSSSSDSSSDDQDAMHALGMHKLQRTEDIENKSSSSSSSSSSSDDDDDDEGREDDPKHFTPNHKRKLPSVSSKSNTPSTLKQENNKKKKTRLNPENDSTAANFSSSLIEEDGFLLADDDDKKTIADPCTVFDHAQPHQYEKEWLGQRGDKSQGWATQKQEQQQRRGNRPNASYSSKRHPDHSRPPQHRFSSQASRPTNRFSRHTNNSNSNYRGEKR